MLMPRQETKACIAKVSQKHGKHGKLQKYKIFRIHKCTNTKLYIQFHWHVFYFIIIKFKLYVYILDNFIISVLVQNVNCYK